jgi:pyrimidine and pyridine-specific 5'-nucleotidase
MSSNILSVPLCSNESSINLENLDDNDLKEREILILNKNSQSTLYLQNLNNKLLKNNLPSVKLTYPNSLLNKPPPLSPNGKIFFFDIDNCLYHRSTRIHDLMQIYIHRYFKKHLHLNDNEAHHLHMSYYKQYGLALEGLVRLHKVDAMDYNKVVDDALPLDKILVPNQNLRNLLLKLKNSGKVERLWLFTNAYKNHALRVIYLLGLGDLFDGLTYCDYNNFPLICKPMEKSFEIAFNESGAINKKNIYFIDDSELNVKAARKYDWGKIIQFVELDSDLPHDLNTYPALDIHIIRSILDIEKVCPELF